jgi:ATP-dependent helicase YprA (DUF1998 family)
MDVFDLDRSLVSDYERFARSFTQIKAADILTQVEAIYASKRFWPEPLISINPNFERGASVGDLAADGTLHPDTARVFRVDGNPIRFHRHQAQAIAKAVRRQSFVVTTGTGSGKSLCFFVPIIDAAIRARRAGEAARTRTIEGIARRDDKGEILALSPVQQPLLDQFSFQCGYCTPGFVMAATVLVERLAREPVPHSAINCSASRSRLWSSIG